MLAHYWFLGRQNTPRTPPPRASQQLPVYVFLSPQPQSVPPTIRLSVVHRKGDSEGDEVPVASCPRLELPSPPHAHRLPSAREPHLPWKTGQRHIHSLRLGTEARRPRPHTYSCTQVGFRGLAWCPPGWRPPSTVLWPPGTSAAAVGVTQAEQRQAGGGPAQPAGPLWASGRSAKGLHPALGLRWQWVLPGEDVRGSEREREAEREAERQGDQDEEERQREDPENGGEGERGDE